MEEELSWRLLSVLFYHSGIVWISTKWGKSCRNLKGRKLSVEITGAHLLGSVSAFTSDNRFSEISWQPISFGYWSSKSIWRCGIIPTLFLLLFLFVFLGHFWKCLGLLLAVSSRSFLVVMKSILKKVWKYQSFLPIETSWAIRGRIYLSSVFVRKQILLLSNIFDTLILRHTTLVGNNETRERGAHIGRTL